MNDIVVGIETCMVPSLNTSSGSTSQNPRDRMHCQAMSTIVESIPCDDIDIPSDPMLVGYVGKGLLSRTRIP